MRSELDESNHEPLNATWFRGSPMSSPRLFSICIAAIVLNPLLGLGQNEQRFVGRLTFKDVKVTALAMTADSKYVLWGFSSGTLSIVAPQPGKTVTIEAFPAHNKAVSCANFSPDGKWLASGGVDGNVKLWETYVIARYQDECQNRKEGAAKPPYPQAKKSFAAHATGVNTLAYSPDGKKIATGGPDGYVKVWNAETTKPIFSFLAHKGAVHSVAFSPDGNQIASGGADKTAKLWKSMASGSGAHKPDFTLGGHEGPVYSVAYSPDGKMLATGTGVAKKSGVVRIWEVENGKEEYKLAELEDVVTTVCFHPNLTRLAVGGKDKKIRVYSLEKKMQLYIDEHADGLIRVLFTGDGGRLGSICHEEAKYWVGSPKFE
jgi:WD40 repeat protein